MKKLVIYKGKGIGPTISVPLKLPDGRHAIHVCQVCGTVFVGPAK